MPRCKPGRRTSTGATADLLRRVEALVTAERQFAALYPQERAALTAALVNAVGFACAGLPAAAKAAGRQRARSHAWTLDVFMRDVADALAVAGVAVTMNPNPTFSFAQGFAMRLARLGGLNPTNMFEQNQRQRVIAVQCVPAPVLSAQMAQARRVMRDPLGWLHMNPGACGHHGWHTVRTLMRFTATSGKIGRAELIELGPRGHRAGTVQPGH